MYREIRRCRMCGNTALVPILHLGDQELTGVFPQHPGQRLTSGPLELVKCHGDPGAGACGLVQLRHSYEPTELYGWNYGYRSGLNQSMVAHLRRRVEAVTRTVPLGPGDLVLDIGSNDSTLLQGYDDRSLLLVGMDPTGIKFKDYYPPHIRLVPDFFSAATFRASFGSRKARIITSIAMLYDLESPLDFMQQVSEVLADDGVWVFEQSYMPAMLEMNAYDTVCHEHLEYYGLEQIRWLTDRAGLKILDVEINTVNGGSFAVTVAKPSAPYRGHEALIEKMRDEERRGGLHTLAPYEEFRRRVFEHRTQLTDFIGAINRGGGTILGYGASTKGNVILQFCGLGTHDLPCIAEINADKFGRYTPGTFIPIVSEEEARARRPDYFLVLPWHFKDSIVERERTFLGSGGRLVMPLPRIEVVEAPPPSR